MNINNTSPMYYFGEYLLNNYDFMPKRYVL